MTFNTSQTKRFYQVYPQDSKTTVGHFNLKGTLVAQQSDGKRELSKVCQSGNGCHAEERFLSECAKQLGTISEGEKATLSLNIKITYSPCSKCRTAIKNFFASLPQDRNSSYQLCIQFANLYHEKSASTVDEIKHLAAWSQSLKDINVVADLKPLCVTKDPEFNPTNLDISCDKIIRKRERKDKEVERHVQQIASLKAKDLKEQGNAFFKEGNLPMAINRYTEAIQLDPTNHFLYSNRSLALCRSGDYERALEDANTSIKLKPSYAKGHYRRGTALTHLKQYSAAASAHKKALKIEPRNQGIKDALSVVNKKLMTERMEQLHIDS